MRSFSNFARFLRPMSEYLCREWPFIVMFREIMLNRVSFVLTDQWAFHTTQQWKAIPDIILRSSVANVERNSKMTVFPEMGIESKLPNQIEWFRYHSLLRNDTLYNDVKILTTFCSQCTENPPFRFLWDTRYIYKKHLEITSKTSSWVIYSLTPLPQTWPRPIPSAPEQRVLIGTSKPRGTPDLAPK